MEEEELDIIEESCFEINHLSEDLSLLLNLSKEKLIKMKNKEEFKKEVKFLIKKIAKQLEMIEKTLNKNN